MSKRSQLSYEQRLAKCSHPLLKRLYQIILTKQSNLSIAVDVTTKAELLKIADTIGPEICVLKTHIDIIEDFDVDLTQQLIALADKHNFLIFEDRKFADIGNTVSLQYAKGVYHIADWAHITNAHIIPGSGIIDGLKKIGKERQRGLLLLAQMSSQGTFAKGDYTKANIDLAKQHKDFVIGFIATENLTNDPDFIHMTPGIKLAEGNDDLGQQYVTPQQAIIERGTDIIIVGRGIYHANNPQHEAQRYRQAGWEAYEATL